MSILAAHSAPSFSRADGSYLGRWWWSVDRTVLACALGLIGAGLVLAFAASPAATARLGVADPFHFADRQALFAVPAVLAVVLGSMTPPRWAARAGAALFAGALGASVFAAAFGPEFNGAQRWIPFGPINLQPAEFLKPGFAVFAGWMFARGREEADFPAPAVVAGAFGVSALTLALQPDYGQAALLGAIWAGVFFTAGMSLRWAAGLAVTGVAGLFGAYAFAPHVASRIDRFIRPESGDTYQVDAAWDAVANGGLFGVGPGEGVVKWRLPDAHTDFIFAVAAEEYGALAAALLIGAVGVVTAKGLGRAAALARPLDRIAATGLFAAFGLQALIHVGVTLQVLPAKGMTFPFVSYGGSSLLASAIGLGLALSLCRGPRRAGAR